MANNNIQQHINSLIHDNKVVLFMKGTKDKPMCGFSSTVSQILKLLQVDFFDINVLENEEIRQGIKDFSDWPTIPQLYINGEFVGGCDITREMYQNGELKQLLGQ
jgi:monothiol glutaredoxin